MSGQSKTKTAIAVLGAVCVLLAGGIVAVLLVGASGGDSDPTSDAQRARSNDPEDVAELYLEAAARSDFALVCELSSAERQSGDFASYDADSCDELVAAQEADIEPAEIEAYEKDFESDFDIDDVEEVEDTAEVEYSVTVSYTGDDEDLASYYDEDGEQSEGILELVREDGIWKVDADTGGY